MFNFIKRISLFLVTNLAVVVTIGGIMTLLQYFGLFSRLGGLGPIFIYSFLAGFLGAIISLFLSKRVAKSSYNIQLIHPNEVGYLDRKLQIVWNTIERIAQKEGINMPEVGYYESAEPNAFATGTTKNSALVAVSTGLLNVMKENEIEGVVGHEMAHVINGDMVTLTLITGVMNTFVYAGSYLLAQVVTSFLSRNDDEDDSSGGFVYYSIVNVLQVVLGLLANLVIMWFSRIREYRADLGGAECTSKSSMIAGLRRLKSMQELQGESNGALRSFMITEPKDSIFSTHPSLDNRIQALEENYKLA